MSKLASGNTLINAIPPKWKQAIKNMTIPFVWNSDPDDYSLTINSVKIPVSKVNTKNLYGVVLFQAFVKNQQHKRNLTRCFLISSVIGVKYTVCLSRLC